MIGHGPPSYRRGTAATGRIRVGAATPIQERSVRENLICLRNPPKPLSHVGGETVDHTAKEVERGRVDTLDAATRSWETVILNPYVRL